MSLQYQTVETVQYTMKLFTKKSSKCQRYAIKIIKIIAFIKNTYY